MRKFFITADFKNAGECVAETPVNPDGLDIIEYDGLYDPEIGASFDGVGFTNPVKTQMEIIKSYKDAIQDLLDSAAVDKGYDDIVSACSYAGYPNVFQAEAISFGVWRSQVWAYCYAELDKVIAGTRPVPTIEQILSELPTRVLL